MQHVQAIKIFPFYILALFLQETKKRIRIGSPHLSRPPMHILKRDNCMHNICLDNCGLYYFPLHPTFKINLSEILLVYLSMLISRSECTVQQLDLKRLSIINRGF